MRAILFIAALAFFGCSKKDSTDNTTSFDSLIGKLLICDSIRLEQGSFTTTRVVGQGQGLDVMYSSSTYTVYSNPQIIKNYQYEAPNKHYYWQSPGSMQSNQFYRYTVEANKFVTVNTEGGSARIYTSYFHY